jgi:hypothetical protein
MLHRVLVVLHADALPGVDREDMAGGSYIILALSGEGGTGHDRDGELTGVNVEGGPREVFGETTENVGANGVHVERLRSRC